MKRILTYVPKNNAFSTIGKTNLNFQNTFRAFSIMDRIPVIDAAPLLKTNTPDNIKAKKEVGRQIDEANKEIGFFLVKNTGIDFKFVKEVLGSAEKFFFQDLDEKMNTKSTDPDEAAWGFYPRNTELLRRSQDYDKKIKGAYLSDINEQFNLQNDHPDAKMPKRKLPLNPKDFSANFSKYYKQAEKASNLLMQGFAYGLNLNGNYFDNMFSHCASALRVLYYPANVQLQPGQFRASEHTDYGALTLLYSTAPGLQVKRRDGKWIDVEVPDEHFVINLGDLMAFWSNDRWVSTPHRVVAKENENPHLRFSLVFFHNPNAEQLIECIPSCKSAEQPAKYNPVTSGEFVMKKFHSSIGK
jgi:isopenicillin N synthase-like dioxygenase